MKGIPGPKVSISIDLLIILYLCLSSSKVFSEIILTLSCGEKQAFG